MQHELIDGKRKGRTRGGVAAEKTNQDHAEDGHIVSPTTSHIRREATASKGHVQWSTGPVTREKEDAGRQVEAFPASEHGSPEVAKMILVDRRCRLFGM